MSFNDYFSLLIDCVPHDVYIMLFVFYCIGAIYLIASKGLREGGRYSMALLLGGYIFLLFCSTVLCRDINLGGRYYYGPFMSYERIIKGVYDAILIPQIIMNLVAFLPVGFLGGCVFRKNVFGRVLGIGIAVSLSIEIMQYLFQRGFSEFDDVFHNTLGAIIGYGIFYLCHRGRIQQVKMKRKSVIM